MNRPRRNNAGSDQNITSEIAIVRQEIAQRHSQLEEASESLRALNIALLRHMEMTAEAIRDLQAESNNPPRIPFSFPLGREASQLP
jgi:hypothetical protein